MKNEDTGLQNLSRSEYGGDWDSAVLDQWKVCVDAANGIAEKRNASNSVYITINTALLAYISANIDYKTVFLSVIGLIICMLWKVTISNYRKLSTVKFGIVDLIEKELPLAPNRYEWNELSRGKKYVGLSKIEGILPWLFALLYTASAVWAIVKAFV